jgi:hypothetical protein
MRIEDIDLSRLSGMEKLSIVVGVVGALIGVYFLIRRWIDEL